MTSTWFDRHAALMAEAVTLIGRANRAPLEASYARRTDAIDISVTRYAPSGEDGKWARAAQAEIKAALEQRLKREATAMARDVRLQATERLRQIRAGMLTHALNACTDLTNIIEDLDAATRAMADD